MAAALTPERYATPAEVAKILRLPITTLHRLCREGRLPGAFKVGHKWRIDLEVLLRSQSQPAAA